MQVCRFREKIGKKPSSISSSSGTVHNNGELCETYARVFPLWHHFRIEIQWNCFERRDGKTEQAQWKHCEQTVEASRSGSRRLDSERNRAFILLPESIYPSPDQPGVFVPPLMFDRPPLIGSDPYVRVGPQGGRYATYQTYRRTDHH